MDIAATTEEPMTMNTSHTIPYGISSFPKLRESNGYFVDRTRLIPVLEELRYQLFLRPRRFGKSLLLSILECYYDVNFAERFDELFGGTAIHDCPTKERGQYLVLHFDFSRVGGATVEELQCNFEEYCLLRLDDFCRQYAKWLPDYFQDLTAHSTFAARFTVLTDGLRTATHKIYIFIDEYDNFTNSVLAENGEQFYNALCHGKGFFKGFFAQLKSATGGTSPAVDRIFLTGVSPVTLDDVTSGFNIADNISLDPRLATICGFTHDDIRACLDHFAADGRFLPDREETFRVLLQWYDNYRFAKKAETICNPILFLGFLKHCVANGELPDEMLDQNARTDYTKLRYLVTTENKLNGEFRALERLAVDGAVLTPSLKETFQARDLHEPGNFLSLLYYYGLVTYGGLSFEGLRLAVPNQIIRDTIAGMIRDGYRDICRVSPQTEEIATLLGRFARTGDWRPAVELAAQAVQEAVTARDLLDGEKAVQAALAAFLAGGTAFMARTEHQAGDGFADLALAPRLAIFPDIRHAAIIEVKYIPQKTKVTAALKRQILADARGQLERYAAAHAVQTEWCLAPEGTVALHRIAVAFHGAKPALIAEL